MRYKNVTMNEIAKKASVSMTAVSFALNGKEGISEDTREKILEIAKDLGYTIPTSKRALNIAVVFRSDISQFVHMFYNELNAYIIDACRDLPINLMMAKVYQDENGIALSDNLRSDLCDGILVYGDQEPSVLDALRKLHVPFVVLDSSRRGSAANSVFVDYKKAAYAAAHYLIEKGHRDIVYIGNNQESMQDFNILTFRGFQKAMEEEEIALSANHIQLDVTDEASLRAAIDRAMSGGSRPTALFCSADYYALYALRYFYEIGLHVPEDISVIGIDDIALSSHVIPSLTTVHINRDEIGRVGLNMIRKLALGEKASNVSIKEFSVVERESVADLRKAWK